MFVKSEDEISSMTAAVLFPPRPSTRGTLPLFTETITSTILFLSSLETVTLSPVVPLITR